MAAPHRRWWVMSVSRIITELFQVLRPSTPGSGFVDLLLMREQTTGERGGTDVLSMGILGT